MTAWAQFDQLLTCAICLDRFRNPKLLPCQHTFCMEPCLDGLIDYVRRQIKCPECRAEHRIPYKGIQEFPTNVTLMRFLELHREVTGEEPEPPPCMMERCAVCTEKSFCEKCHHCGKKVCEECKEAHIDIMKREIIRINNQVKRSMNRLTDALTLVVKNSHAIEQNTFNLKDEIEDLSRRLEKDLKDREKNLLDEIEDFKVSEEKSVQEIKENIEQEIENLNSNCDLCEQHINDKVEWSDVELVEYKDCFLKMLEFLRNFDVENVDSGQRRLKLIYKMDPHLLHQNVKAFAEIKSNDPNAQNQSLTGQGTTLQVPSSGQGGQNALMRSQSDHRLAAQFQRTQRSDSARSMLDVSQKYGPGANESDRDKESPLSGRRGTYGLDSSSSRYSRYGDRSSTRDLDEVKSGSRFLKDDHGSRNWRDRDDDVVSLRESFRQRYGLDPPSEPQESESRTVRFAEEEIPQQPLERLFDCEAAKGPLSGIVKLVDCPKLQERLHQKEKKTKVTEVEKAKKEAEQKAAQQVTVVPKRPATNRQTSEDEIEKQKRLNKEAADALNERAAAATEAARPLSRRVAALQRDDDRSRRSQDDSESDLDSTRRNKPASDDSQSEMASSRRSSRDETASPMGGRMSPADSTASSRQSTPTRRKPYMRPGHARNSSTGGTYSPINEHGDSSDSDSELRPLAGYDVTRRSRDKDQERKRRSANFTRASSNDSQEEDLRRDVDTPTTPPLASPFFRRSKATVTPPPPAAGSSYPHTAISGTNSHSSGISSVAEPRNRASLTKTRSLDQSDDSASSYRSKFATAGRNQSTDRDQTTSSRPSSGGFTSRFLPRQATVEDKSETETETESEDSDEDEDKFGTVRRRKSDTVSPAINALLVRAANARSAAKPEDQEKSNNYTSRFQSAYARSKERNDRPSSSQGNYRTYGNEDQANLDDDTSNRFGSSSRSGPTSSSSRRYTSDNRNADDDSPSYNRYLTKSRSSAAIAGMGRDTSPSRSGDRIRKRSRFMPLRNRVGRSKSSHDIWAEDSGDEDTRSTSYINRRRSSERSLDSGPLSRCRSNHALRSREASIEDEEEKPTKTTSPWAKYLRSRYKSQKSSSSGSGSVVGRSKSSGALYSRDDSDDNERPSSSARRSSLYTKDNSLSLSYGRLSENPRTTYLQKRRMIMKIGNRGSDRGYFTWPRGVAIGPDNMIVVADSSNHRVQIFDSNGRFLKEFGKYGSGEGEFDCLAGVAVNRIGQFIISDRYNHRIQIFDPSGRFLRCFGCEGRSDGRFSYPWGIATDSLGFIYVCDKENHRVQVFQADGTFVGKFGSIGNRPGQLEHPHYIAVSNTNRVIVSDSNNHRIQIFDVNGRCVSSIGSEGSEEGQFKMPRGVAVDDQGYIFVGDSGNNRIQVFQPDGTFLKSFGSWGNNDGEFKGLEGLAVMPNGNILVCDRENHRIQLF